MRVTVRVVRLTARRRLAALAAGLVLLAACGGSDDGDPAGRAGPDDLVAEVASFDLAVGPPSRFIVGLLSGDRRFLAFGTVQFRFSYLGTKEENKPGPYGDAVNAGFLPIPGTRVPSPVPTEPRYVSGSETRGVYVAGAGFPRAGFYQVEVTAKVGGKERKATAALAVNERHVVPAPGDPALATETLTMEAPADVPRPAIDSRAATGEIPDAHLHQTTIAAALAAKRPVVAVFATPVYCQSQFCGPVTDMVANLARTYGDRASFVHVEIWRDFQARTINKSAADWLLREDNLTEPWVYVIGADGRITHRFDNVATAEELEPILKQLPVIGPPT